MKYQDAPSLQTTCIRCGSTDIDTDVIDPLRDKSRREESCECHRCGLEWAHQYWTRHVVEMCPHNVDFNVPALPEFPEVFLVSLQPKGGD